MIVWILIVFATSQPYDAMSFPQVVSRDFVSSAECHAVGDIVVSHYAYLKDVRTTASYKCVAVTKANP